LLMISSIEPANGPFQSLTRVHWLNALGITVTPVTACT
jgi:hypothetical protein